MLLYCLKFSANIRKGILKEQQAMKPFKELIKIYMKEKRWNKCWKLLKVSMTVQF